MKSHISHCSYFSHSAMRSNGSDASHNISLSRAKQRLSRFSQFLTRPLTAADLTNHGVCDD